MRIIRPVCFVLFLCVLITCAFISGRGASFTDSIALSRFAEFALNSPVIAFISLFFGLPFFFLFFSAPHNLVATFAVSLYGTSTGIVLSFIASLIATLLCFAISRLFLAESVQNLFKGQKFSAFLAEFRLTKLLSIESCLLLEVLLLILPIPKIIAGFVLGLSSMRPKAFGLAAAPLIFIQCVMAGLSTASVGGGELFFLALPGIICLGGLIAFLVILCISKYKQFQEDLADANATASAPATGQSLNADSEANSHVGNSPLEELSEEDEKEEATLTNVDGVFVVCLSDLGCTDETILPSLVNDVKDLGLPYVECKLVPNTDLFRVPVTSGFTNHTQLRDIDEAVQRAFREGASSVLVIRPASPFLRRNIIVKALKTLQQSAGILLPAEEGGTLLLGVRREARFSGVLRSCKVGIFSGKSFTDDLTSSLASFCSTPILLPALPMAKDLAKPYVSVLIPNLDKASLTMDSVDSASGKPWVECIVIDGGSQDQSAEKVTSLGAEFIPAHGSDRELLNEGAKAAHGEILLFLAPGSCLPENFDAYIWESLHQQGAVAGMFSPASKSTFSKKVLSLLGSVFRKGSFAATIGQGLFVPKSLFEELGGFSTTAKDCIADFLQQLDQKGSFITHNARMLTSVSLEEEVRQTSLICKLQEGIERFSLLFKKHEEIDSPDNAPLQERVQAMVAECNHCGACTKNCSMLARHDMDLAKLIKFPLLAWHCFLCGDCTRVCPVKIDGAGLAQILRRIYINNHGGRLSRPGHSATLFMNKFASVVMRYAKPGENILITHDFCTIYPKTAIALVKRAQDCGIGTVIAQSGEELASLGLESKAEEKYSHLVQSITNAGVTKIITISPKTHSFLEEKGGIAVESIYSYLPKLCITTRINAAPYALFTPCADRKDRVFEKAILGYLDEVDLRLDNIPCCGAGGEASVLEGRMAASLKSSIASCGKPILTSCVKCAATLKGAGCETKHVLSLLLEIDEDPQLGVSKLRALPRIFLALNNKEKTPIEERNNKELDTAQNAARGENPQEEATPLSFSKRESISNETQEETPPTWIDTTAIETEASQKEVSTEEAPSPETPRPLESAETSQASAHEEESATASPFAATPTPVVASPNTEAGKQEASTGEDSSVETAHPLESTETSQASAHEEESATASPFATIPTPALASPNTEAGKQEVSIGEDSSVETPRPLESAETSQSSAHEEESATASPFVATPTPELASPNTESSQKEASTGEDSSVETARPMKSAESSQASVHEEESATASPLAATPTPVVASPNTEAGNTSYSSGVSRWAGYAASENNGSKKKEESLGSSAFLQVMEKRHWGNEVDMSSASLPPLVTSSSTKNAEATKEEDLFDGPAFLRMKDTEPWTPYTEEDENKKSVPPKN